MDQPRPDEPVEPMPGPPADEASMGPFQKLFNVLLSPTETFEAVRRRPDWLLPLIVITLVGVAVAYVITPKMDMDDFYGGIVERQAEAEGWDEAQVEEKLAEMKEQAAAQGRPWLAVFTTPALMALIALVFWGAMRAAGGNNTYQQTLGVTTYGWMPNVLKGILVVVFAARRDSIPFSERSTVVTSNLGFLVSPSENPALHSFLTWIDLFSIWTLVLLAIGLAVITGFSKMKVGIFMAVLYAVMIAVGVGFTVLMASFLG